MRKKRLLSFVLAAAIAVSSFSLTAFADEAVKYDLFVNGEQFSSDKLTIKCGEGTAVFDGKDTLTLTDAVIETPSASPEGSYMYGVINSGIKDLTIVVNGTNNLNGTAQNDGIDAAGGCNVTVKGKGTLNFNNCYYGTYIGSWDVPGADFTVSDGATVKVLTPVCAGLWVNHDITFNDSSVTVFKDNLNYNGIVSNIGGTITVTNSDLTVTNYCSAILMGNADNSSHAMVINSGNVKLTSTSSDKDNPTIKVVPAEDESINGKLTVNGGTLDVTSSYAGTNIPDSAITLADGVNYIKGNSLSESGNVIIAAPTLTTIGSLDISIAVPKAGTKVTSEPKTDPDWGFAYVEQNPRPVITLEKDANYKLDYSAYVDNYQSDEHFVGTFEAGKKYYAEVCLAANEGFCFAGNDTMELTVNGKKTDLEMSKHNAKGANVFTFYAAFTVENSDPYIRLKGSGRYATAAAISTAAYPETAETVVLANGRKFYDALAGVTLANAYGAPILLTEADSLPAETLAEIKRLKAKKVIILGGSGSVGAEVKTELEKNNLKYEIVKGSSRFATAVEIANKTKEKTQTDPTEIFFVSSDKFADALSVSAVAALKNAPIIYLPKTGAIDDVTAAYLKTMKGKIKNAYVIGGSGVIGADVMAAAGKALGLTVDKTIVRVKGKTKYDTCVAVNTKFASVLKGTAICVATGEDFPDALAGGVFAAQKSAPLFLAAGTLSDTQKSYLQSKNADSIFVFGGSKSVPDSLVQSIAAASTDAPGKFKRDYEIF